jgi:hypothetical protein
MLQPLCMPALIFLIYSVANVIVEMYKENYDKALSQFFVSAVFTFLLNILCRQGLGIVSWIIISIPFLLMTTIAAILVYSFKVNPSTGEPLPPPTQTPTHPAGNVYPIQVQYTKVPPTGKPTASVTTVPPPDYPAPVYNVQTAPKCTA